MLSVLWLSVGLSAIAFSVSSSVRSETDHVSTSADGLRTWYLASGSVERGIQWMLWGDAYRSADGQAQFWAQNQPRMYMSFPSGDAVVEAIPESAKLNVNAAPADLLYRVVLSVAGDEERAALVTNAILDWRGGGGPNSLDSYYLSISPTFRPRHSSFQEIEELLLVRGMTPELYYGNYMTDAQGHLSSRGGLRDCLSVWGSPTGPFDVNAASPVLLQALGVPLEGAAAIVARRQRQPFGNLAEVIAMGIPVPGLTVGGNTIWTLRGTARLRLPDGSPSEVVRTAAAVVKILNPQRHNIPLHVLRWYDDAWSQDAVKPFPGMRVGGRVLPPESGPGEANR